MNRQFFGKKTIRNASWLIGGRIAQMMINLLVGLLTARYLGPSSYGLIGYATAYTGFFSCFCTLGINSVLVKEFIDNPDQEGKIVGTVLGLRTCSSLLSAICILLIVCTVDAGDSTAILVVGLSCVGMVFHSVETFQYWFQSRLQSKFTAIATLVAYIVTAIYKVILMVTGKNVVYFAFATSVDYIFIGIFQLIGYKKLGGSRFSFSWKYAKHILSKSCHFILPSLMIAVYGQTDKVMLRQIVNDAELGYYSTAVSISGVWCFVLSAIIDSVHPSIMQLSHVNEKEFIKKNKQLYVIVFYLSVSVSLVITVLAKLAISIMYGSSYLPAANALRILTWYTAFSYLGVARNAWIVCKGRQNRLIYVYAVSAVANVIMNFLMIPPWGASGAALASLITQMLTTMVVPLMIRDLKENAIMMFEAILFKGIQDRN